MRKTNNRIDSFGPVCFWPISSHRVNFWGNQCLCFLAGFVCGAAFIIYILLF